MHASQAILAARSMLAAAHVQHAAANAPADQEADNEWADTTDGSLQEEEIDRADAMDEEVAAAAPATVEAAAGAPADAAAAAVLGDMWAWDDEVSCCHQGFLFAYVWIYCFETQCKVS